MSSVEEELNAIVGLISKSAKKDINSGALSTGGKLYPAGSGSTKKPQKCACGKADGPTCKCEDETTKADDSDEESNPVSKFCVILKANSEEQIVTGVVLQPEVVDGQGDIYDADVIRKSAYDFLAKYNKQTKLGLQHNSFKAGRFALVESYIAPINFVLGTKSVKEGSWIMSVKVLDSKIWGLVKEGKITGFSIGGKAKVQKLTAA